MNYWVQVEGSEFETWQVKGKLEYAEFIKT